MYGGFVNHQKIVDGKISPFDKIIEQEIMNDFSLEYDNQEGKEKKRGFIRAMVNKVKSDMDGGLNRRRDNNRKGEDEVVNVIRRKNNAGQAVTVEEKKIAAKRKPMSHMEFDVTYVKTSRSTTTVVSGELGINAKKQRIEAIERQIKDKENERERLEAEILEAMNARSIAPEHEEEPVLMTTTMPEHSDEEYNDSTQDNDDEEVNMVDEEEEVRQFCCPIAYTVSCSFILYTSDSTHDLQTMLPCHYL
jgi:hypothetical protein